MCIHIYVMYGKRMQIRSNIVYNNNELIKYFYNLYTYMSYKSSPLRS